MSWPLLELLQRFVGVAVVQRLDEVCILWLTVWACNRVTVIAEEVQSLMRMQKQLEAVVALWMKWRNLLDFKSKMKTRLRWKAKRNLTSNKIQPSSWTFKFIFSSLRKSFEENLLVVKQDILLYSHFPSHSLTVLNISVEETICFLYNSIYYPVGNLDEARRGWMREEAKQLTALELFLLYKMPIQFLIQFQEKIISKEAFNIFSPFHLIWQRWLSF